MSDERLRSVLMAAVKAIRESPDYKDSDGVCIILADGETTHISSSGFPLSTDLAGLLRYHAGKLDQAG